MVAQFQDKETKKASFEDQKDLQERLFPCEEIKLTVEDINSMVEDIDPLTAERYLKTQKNNRNANAARVTEYADRMIKEQWMIGQPIIFDENDCLIDGQHRLRAVVRYGKPVCFLVVRGLPEKSASILDIGQKRSVAQVAKIQGVKQSSLADRTHILNAAMLGYSLRLRQKEDELARNLLNIIPSVASARFPQTMIDLMVKYEEGLDFVIKRRVGRESRKSVGDYSAIKGAVFRAYYHVDRTRLEEFLDVFQNGFPSGNSDFAAMALRNYITAIRSGERKVRFDESINLDMYKKTESAILNFQAKNPIMLLRGSEFEEFPLADFD
jgi:hypothetical protein